MNASEAEPLPQADAPAADTGRCALKALPAIDALAT